MYFCIMKKSILFFLILFLSVNIFAQVTLSGRVIDKVSGDTLTGSTVYIPDLKTGAVSNKEGFYKIDNLPKIKVLVQVSFIGYKTIIETINLSTTTTKNFILEMAVKEMNAVVITGSSKASEIKDNPVPIITIDKKQMDQNISTNAIDALTKLPGVTAVTTGPNISKPFIRGLGYNRILTLYDGVRQEGQQWGDEHGIEVDEYSIDKVEVLKGPASLIYGSDALAGVVNLMPEPPVPSGIIKGNLLTNYQTNNGLCGVSGSFAGNTNGFIWSGRISHKQATNYTNKYDGRVFGTAFNESDASANIGLNKRWGYSHLNFTLYDDLQEIPDGSRDSITRKFTKQITEADTFRPIVSENELRSYKIEPLHQHIQHYRIYSSNIFIIGDGKLGLTLGYQQSIRREFSHPQATDVAGLDLNLKTFQYDLKYYLPEIKGWETTIGVNGTYQTNTNEGTEFIIPDYHQFDIGTFFTIKKSFKKLDMSGGVRFDNRFFNNSEMYTRTNPVTGFDEQVQIPDTAGASHVFKNYKHTFSGITGSIGATYSLSKKIVLKINVARGFRAPNISEISANGVHPGTNIYQIGNSNFNPEFNLQEDAGIFYSTNHVAVSVEVFNNNISNYIYNEKVLGHLHQDSIIVKGNETFKYQQAQAQLYGGEASIDIHPHPLDWLHFENSVSVVYAVNKGASNDSAKYLPFIPPVHTLSELRADIKKKFKHFSSLYFKVEMEHYAKQDRAFLAYNTETVTPGYTLFNAGFGTDIINSLGKVLFTIHISCNNLTDVAYQSNMSRLKYFEQYPVNWSGRSGIYNMGRNISFKLVIPLDFKNSKK